MHLIKYGLTLSDVESHYCDEEEERYLVLRIHVAFPYCLRYVDIAWIEDLVLMAQIKPYQKSTWTSKSILTVYLFYPFFI